MVAVQEEQSRPLSDAQGNGIQDSNPKQTIIFKQYKRVVLPIDGYIFWLSTGDTLSVEGSLSISSEIIQNVSETYEAGQIAFTCNNEIKPFYSNDETFIWVGEIQNKKFVIGSQQTPYKQAGLYQYQFKKLSPLFASQFIDDVSEINDKEVIVSNSLPFFLSLPSDPSPALAWCPWPEKVPVFPGYCVPENQSPPYVVVYNDPDTIEEISLSKIIMADNYIKFPDDDSARESFQFQTSVAEGLITLTFHWNIADQRWYFKALDSKKTR